MTEKRKFSVTELLSNPSTFAVMKLTDTQVEKI